MSNEAKTDELCHCPRYSTAHAPQPACSKTKPEAATGETRPAEATNPLVEDEATTTLVAETAEPVDNGRGPTSDWRSCIDVHPAADLLHQRQTHALKVGSLVISATSPFGPAVLDRVCEHVERAYAIVGRTSA